jgi:transcription termination/antitermination protein NusA
LARVKISQETLGLTTLMERLTGAKVKDCFQNEETLYFVVAAGDLGKAVGRKGSNIKTISKEFGKKIKIIEYSDSLVKFIKNVIYPLKVAEINHEESNVIIRDSSKKTKSLLIGRGGKNLNLLNRAVKRFFSVEVKVE